MYIRIYIVCKKGRCGIICESGYFYSWIEENCIKCSGACKECFGVSERECFSCSSALYIYRDLGYCKVISGDSPWEECLEEEFFEEGTQSCVPCRDNCIKCPDFTGCSDCAMDYIFYSTAMVCLSECHYGTYLDETLGECLDCPDPCASCLASHLCTSCLLNYYLLDNSCVILCPHNSFFNALNQCQLCHPLCTKCNGPADYNCTQCNTTLGYYLTLTNQCLSNCPGGEFYDTLAHRCQGNIYIYIYIYIACHERCLECYGPTVTDCSPCKGNYTYDLVLHQCKSCEEMKSGLRSVGDGSCEEICGDAINLGLLPCEDGNLDDGDGCSSSCTFEKDFLCKIEESNGLHICTETLQPSVSIQRVSSNNQIYFTFSETVISHICNKLLSIIIFSGFRSIATCIRYYNYGDQGGA